MAHTQDNRHIAITTPLGKDVLLLKGFSGHEAVSRLFSFEVDLLSEVDPAIDFDAIVGKSVTIRVKHAGGTRFFNGIVNRFAQGGQDASSFASYRATIVPWLWLLTQTADCRIFQNLSVPDIIQQIFKDLGFSDFKVSLTGAFPPRDFCVQYRETDFNFVSRLMEQYGISYFFEHVDGKHTLVLVNSPGSHPDCSPSAVRYHAPAGAVTSPDDVVSAFTKEQEIRSGKYALADYNFETPSVKLSVSVDSVFPNAKLEVYDYPGEFQKRDEGDRLVKLRIEEEEAQRSVMNGASGCRQFTAGCKFTLSGHFRADVDGAYVLTSVQHSAAEHGYDSGGATDSDSYSNSFACIPAAVPFRPPRITPRPIVQGSQTAEVVGPKGEEIFTDKFGRVKAQFHWDRQGKKDENSSCWIRVSHPWAGKGWGSVSIPRIGQEVIVDFLEGDPDQPIITGRVYNGELMPPYGLPAEGMISGVKSNSTKGGGGYNEMSLNDTKGKELITVHGQYDMVTGIEHDRTETIGNNELIDVGNNRTETVGKNETISIGANRSESVEENESVSVGGNRNLSVAKNESTSIGANRSESVTKNETIEIGDNRTETVGKKELVTVGDDRDHQIKKNDSLTVGKNLILDAGDSITIKTGDASLTMKKDGTIALKGKDISLTGSGKISVKADGDVVIKGSKISQN